MLDTLIPELFKLGVVGVVVVLLIWLLLRADKRNTQLETQIAELVKLLHETDGKRVSESREVADIVRGNATALYAMSEQIKAAVTAFLGRRSK